MLISGGYLNHGFFGISFLGDPFGYTPFVSATIAGTSGARGSLAGVGLLTAATVSGNSTAGATALVGTGPIASSSSSTSGAQGTLGSAGFLVGTARAVSSVSGALTGSGALGSGRASSTTGVSGALTLPPSPIGSAATGSVSSVSASLTTYHVQPTAVFALPSVSTSFLLPT